MWRLNDTRIGTGVAIVAPVTGFLILVLSALGVHIGRTALIGIAIVLAFLAIAGLALIGHGLVACRNRRSRQTSHSPATMTPVPELSPRFAQTTQYQHRPIQERPEYIEHRLGIVNTGSVAATGVRLVVEGMAPYPSKVMNQCPPPSFPEYVPLLTGGDAAAGITLEPGREEMWKLGETDNEPNNPDIGMTAIGFVGDRRFNWWQFNPTHEGEWRLRYRIEHHGYPPIPFSIVICPEGNELQCHLEG